MERKRKYSIIDLLELETFETGVIDTVVVLGVVVVVVVVVVVLVVVGVVVVLVVDGVVVVLVVDGVVVVFVVVGVVTAELDELDDGVSKGDGVDRLVHWFHHWYLLG